MKIINCTCGKMPEQDMIQAFNVIKCYECDNQAFHLDYDTCVKKWNEMNAPVKILNSDVDPIEFFVQESEKNNV